MTKTESKFKFDFSGKIPNLRFEQKFEPEHEKALRSFMVKILGRKFISKSSIMIRQDKDNLVTYSFSITKENASLFAINTEDLKTLDVTVSTEPSNRTFYYSLESDRDNKAVLEVRMPENISVTFKLL